MEQTQILPPAQTCKRGERAHVRAFSSLIKNNDTNTDEKNESQFSFTYVNEKAGKAYANTFLGRTQRKKKTVIEHQHANITCVCPFENVSYLSGRGGREKRARGLSGVRDALEKQESRRTSC